LRIRATLVVRFLLILLCSASAGAQGAERLFEAGRRAFQDGMYVMAARNFRQVADQYPDSSFADDAEYLSAVSDFYLGEFRSCVAALKDYTRRYPRSENNRRVSYWLGSANFQLLDYAEALSNLSEQVDRYPDEQPYNDHALLLKGMVEENLQLWEDAKRSYGRLLERESARALWPESLYRSGGLFLRSADYSRSLTAFSRIVVQFPDSPYADEALFFLGESHFFLRRYAEAERSYRSVLAGTPTAEQWQTSLYRLAVINAEMGRNQRALELCGQLEDRFPRSRYLDALSRLSADLLFDLGRYGSAYDAYEKSLASSSGPEESQVIYYNMGLSAFLNGDMALAVPPLEKALRGEAGIAEQSLFRLAAAQLELGRAGEARERYEEFRRRYPGSGQREEATRILAALSEKSGDPEKAERLYTELITRYPDSSHQDEYLFRRGGLHLSRGEYPAALRDFNSLQERRPESEYTAESRYNIGYIYSKRGEYNRASPYFAEVLASDPASELAGRAVLAAGVCAFNSGEYDRAIEWFQKNTSEEPVSSSEWVGESWFYLGRTRYKLEQLEQAVQTFGRAAELLRGSGQGEEAQFWKGLSEFRLDRLEAAKATFVSLAARYPGGRREAESHYRAGICAFQLDAYAESIEYYDRALKATKNLAVQYRNQLRQEILFQKGLSYLQTGERPQALQTFEALSSEFPGSTLASEAFFRIAEEDFQAGEYRSAVQGFLLVQQRFPGSEAASSALYWAGTSAARNGERAAALDYLTGYLEKNGGQESAGGLEQLAVQEIRAILAGIAGQGREEEAATFEDFYRRVDRSPSLKSAFKNRVRLEYARYVFEDSTERAMAIAQSIRAEDPAEPLASEVNFLIAEYYRQTDQLDRAFDIFTGIISASSGEPGAASQLGIARILEARGQGEQAAEEYLKVHFLYPDYEQPAAEGLYNAARLYRQEGYAEKAEQLFERLQLEYPDSPWIRQIR